MKKVAQTNQAKIVNFAWKTFECEICKHPYPYVFKYKNRKYNLIDCVNEEIPEAKSDVNENQGVPYLLL